jgi:transposase
MQLACLFQALHARCFWTSCQVQHYIKETFKVSYSIRTIERLLKALDAFFYKPMLRDYRRPENAQGLLEDQILEVLKTLKDKGLEAKDICIGFGDESSPQNYSNTVRLYCMRHLPLRVNTSHIRHSTFGFYAPGSKSTVSEIANATESSFVEMLRRIRLSHSSYKAILLIWDNLAGHKSRLVKEQAQKLGIHLINLPAYSPDLNPIEKIWKQIKRAIGIQGFIENKEELAHIIRTTFKECAKKCSFATAWLNNILQPAAQKIELDFSHLFCRHL